MAGCTTGASYDYSHLPAGYHWRAVYDRRTKAIVFYGQDPFTRDTVYVGPDGRFYIFRHRGPIGPGDLERHWTPHQAASL